MSLARFLLDGAGAVLVGAIAVALYVGVGNTFRERL